MDSMKLMRNSILKTSCQLVIFEGPDGAGKTTAALTYAAHTEARYVHCGAFPRVDRGLARLYVEAMMPAVLGYQTVVMDRCWLSEVPYGLAFRQGRDRLGVTTERMLERLALRCGAKVVRCLPPYEFVKANYLRRKYLELLDNESQLQAVYSYYSTLDTQLPVYDYDYTRSGGLVYFGDNFPCHPLNLRSAGRWGANYLIVGDSFGEVKDQDPLYRWPFASFTGESCCEWLTWQLANHNVRESDLLWINSDEPLGSLFQMRDPGSFKKIFALGNLAAQRLFDAGVHHDQVTEIRHPKAWRQFHPGEPYPLLDHF